MPGTYPAAAPSISGNDVTISRLLQSPEYIRRRLRTFRDLRFVADRLLTARLRSQGGAVLYETGEPIVTDRTPESVAPGSRYPYANLPTGTASLAAVQKWGQKVLLTDEQIARNVFPGDEIDKALRKLVNTIISTIDSLAMSAISSAVTQSFNVTATGGGVWTGATPTFLRDILRAKAIVTKLNMGYMPDTLVVNDDAYAYMASDDKISNAMQRETRESPIYTGEIEVIAGLGIIVSPAVASGNAYVLDSQQLGGMADETDGSPGYAVSDLAVQTKAIRNDGEDSWDLQGRRKTVPVVQEPGAAVKLTNTGL